MVKRKRTLKLGVGATVSVALKHTHPSENIHAVFPNYAKYTRITEGIVTGLT